MWSWNGSNQLPYVEGSVKNSKYIQILNILRGENRADIYLKKSFALVLSSLYGWFELSVLGQWKILNIQILHSRKRNLADIFVTKNSIWICVVLSLQISLREKGREKEKKEDLTQTYFFSALDSSPFSLPSPRGPDTQAIYFTDLCTGPIPYPLPSPVLVCIIFRAVYGEASKTSCNEK